MQRKGAERIRWTVKTAVAAAISQAHEHGLAGALARGPERPLVLGYHRVVEDFDAAARTEMPSMMVSRTMFEHHLDCIGRHFEFVSVEEIGAHLASGIPFDRPVAAVTFDDGYRDVYEHAFPVLQRKGIPAAMFVVSDLIGCPFWQVHDRLYHLLSRAFAAWANPRRELMGVLKTLGVEADAVTRAPEAMRSAQHAVPLLLPELAMADVRRLMEAIEASVGSDGAEMPQTLTWPMVTALRKAGWTIGSHTRSHVSLPAESADTMAEELEGSRAVLEQHLGERVTHFAYPGGQFTPQVVDAVARAGYEFGYTACTHGDGRNPALTIERLLLWEGSSTDAGGRFSPAILSCQAHDLWPRRCERLHDGPVRPPHAEARSTKVKAA